MTGLRIAIIGAGHLGGIHARLLAERQDVQVVSIVDPDSSASQRVAAPIGARTSADIQSVLPEIDAAVVAAPTFLHHDIGCQLLMAGKHVLMEKPLAANLVQAETLVRLAARHDCILQTGHVERFNPALRAADALLEEPKYIEARRTSGFSFRSMDVGVVFDLMIHDLDIILQLVPGEVANVQALGAAVLGGHEDMAQARLEFTDGCVVNLTASRTSVTPERSMHVFCESIQASVDFASRTVHVVRPRQDVLDRSFQATEVPPEDRALLRDGLFDELLVRQPVDVAACNPIADEQSDFVAAVVQRRQPLVSGQDGRNAVALAEQICEAIELHCWDGDAGGRTGPHALAEPTILFPSTDSAASPARRKAG